MTVTPGSGTGARSSIIVELLTPGHWHDWMIELAGVAAIVMFAGQSLQPSHVVVFPIADTLVVSSVELIQGGPTDARTLIIRG